MIGEPDCAGERFGVTTERSCMQKNIVTDPVLLVTENDTGLNNGCGLQSDKGSKFRRVKLSDEARGRPLLRHSPQVATSQQDTRTLDRTSGMRRPCAQTGGLVWKVQRCVNPFWGVTHA